MMEVKVLKPIPGYSYFPGDCVSLSDDLADLLRRKGYVEIKVVNVREQTREEKKK